jgi:hypothetical protein
MPAVMQSTNAFQITGPTQKIAVTGTSAATALNASGQYANQIELNNPSAVEIRIELGASTVVASLTTSYPVYPGQCKVISVPANSTHIAAIGASAGPSNLDVSPGRGL